jgi:TonB family protein
MLDRIFTGIVCVALLGGCATTPDKKPAAAVVQDPEALQIVRVETHGPAGPMSARCGLKNDRGGSEIVTPGVAEVIRSAKPLEIICFTSGFRVAIQSLDSTGDVVGSAATGVVAGGAVSAVAALPLLAIPVMGPIFYMGVVGGGALLGGAVNAADKHQKGKIYSYPPSIVVPMTSTESGGGATSFQVTARNAPLTAPQPIPSPGAASMGAATPVAAATPMPTPVSSPAPTAPSAPFRVASVAPPRSADAPLVPLMHEIPEFPGEAASAGVTAGSVRAKLDIDAEGNVTLVRIVEARPVRVFDRAVTETLARWKFARGAANRQFDAEVEFRR